jgi:hypothetical protein
VKIKKQKQSHIKNHFIPTLYLQQWYGDNYKFFAWEFSDIQSLFCPLIGHRNHGNTEVWKEKLYWLNTKDSDYKISLEKNQFGKLEIEFDKILKKIDSQGIEKLTNLDKLKLLEFSVNLRIRTPKIVNELKSENQVQQTENLLKYNFLKLGGTFPEYYAATSNPRIVDQIKNFDLISLPAITKTKSFPEFLQKKFGKGKLIIFDTQKSHYSLLTSNYPVIDCGNLVIFSISPNKILLVISESILNEIDELFKLRSIDDFVINTNIGILNNHKNQNLGINYQVYGATNQLEKILPVNLINNFFKI